MEGGGGLRLSSSFPFILLFFKANHAPSAFCRCPIPMQSDVMEDRPPAIRLKSGHFDVAFSRWVFDLKE